MALSFSRALHFIASSNRQTGATDEANDSLAYLDCDGDDAEGAAFASDHARPILYVRAIAPYVAEPLRSYASAPSTLTLTMSPARKDLRDDR